jgi:hypothetical protein
MSKAAIPNPALQPFAVLIGDWDTSGTHPLVPDTTLNGHASFQWIEGGAFLIWRSVIHHEGFPEGTALLGSDDVTGEYFMLYFDERKVSRKYEVSIQDGVIKWGRNTPTFSQRYALTVTRDGNVIIGKGELSEDGETWKDDLNLTYTRVK